MTRLVLRTDWLPEPSPVEAFGPERQTWAQLQIILEGQILTSNHPADRPGPEVPHVVGGMSHLAEWIIDNWLPIHFEIHTPFPKSPAYAGAHRRGRFATARDALRGWPDFVAEGVESPGDLLGAWQQRHTFGEATSDIALPSIVLVPEGAWMGIGLDHGPDALSPTVRFSAPGAPDAWPSLPVWVPLADVSSSLAEFVDRVIARAHSQAPARTWASWAGARWDLARSEALDDDTVRRWKFGSFMAQHWTEIADKSGDALPALEGVLQDSAPLPDREALDSVLKVLRGAGKNQFSLDVKPVDYGLPPHSEGYRLADEARRRLRLGDTPIADLDELLQGLGITIKPLAARGLFRSAVCSIGKSAVLAWAKDDPRHLTTAPLRFSKAAALGRLLADRSGQALGAAHGDQSRWRPSQVANAFAAEFLLPRSAILRLAEPSAAILSKTYGISKSATEWHIANRRDSAEA